MIDPNHDNNQPDDPDEPCTIKPVDGGFILVSVKEEIQIVDTIFPTRDAAREFANATGWYVQGWDYGTDYDEGCWRIADDLDVLPF